LPARPETARPSLVQRIEEERHATISGPQSKLFRKESSIERAHIQKSRLNESIEWMLRREERDHVTQAHNDR
jgi:hypothetical protein